MTSDVTITDEDDQFSHLLEMFDGDHVVAQPCHNCDLVAHGVLRGTELVGVSCPWCQHVEWLDEEGITDGST